MVLLEGHETPEVIAHDHVPSSLELLLDLLVDDLGHVVVVLDLVLLLHLDGPFGQLQNEGGQLLAHGTVVDQRRLYNHHLLASYFLVLPLGVERVLLLQFRAHIINPYRGGSTLSINYTSGPTSGGEGGS